MTRDPGTATHHARGRLSRRAFAGGSALTIAMLTGGALPSGFGRAAFAQDGAKEFNAAWPYQEPPQGHYNAFVTDGIFANAASPNIYGDMIWQPMAMFQWGPQEWIPFMATSWGFIRVEDGSATPGASPAASPVASAAASAAASPASGGAPSGAIGPIAPGANVFQITLRQGAKWSDGTEFTSADVLVTLSLMRLMSNVIWKYVDRVEAPDAYTVNFHMSQPSTVVQRYALRTSTQSAAIYGEWAKKADALFEAGKTVADDEVKQLLGEFNQFRPDQIVASGPFTIDIPSVTGSDLTMVKNPQAWNADQVGFDRIHNHNGSGEAIIAVILSGAVDYGTQAFTPPVEAQLVEGGARIVRPPTYSGPAILFNYGTVEVFNDKRVRQAFAHIIDRAQNGTIALGQSGVPPQYMAGMSDTHVKTWLAEADIATLNPYEKDDEKAAALLQEAGWTKDGDTWKLPDGSDAAFDLSFPAEYPDWSASAEDVADQLTSFGITITPLAVAVAQQPIDVDQGKFQMAIRGWGNSSNPHPHFSYVQAFFVHNTLAVNNGGEGMKFPLEQETEVAGKVNLEQLTLDSADGLDENAQREKVTTIAKVYNELLPEIPLFERYGNNMILEERVQPWPADDDPIYKNSPYADGIVTILMLTGALQPK